MAFGDELQHLGLRQRNGQAAFGKHFTQLANHLRIRVESLRRMRASKRSASPLNGASA